MSKKSRNNAVKTDDTPSVNESEWLVVNDMNGNRFIRCANCGAAVHLSKSTYASTMEKYRYCYSCGCRMIIREAN